VIVAFGGKLWLIGGYASSWGMYKNDVWCSLDGASWTCITDSAAFSPRIYHCCVTFNNKIWVIGGLTRVAQSSGIITSPANDVWSSADGVTWEQAVGNVSFPPRCYHSSLVYEDKLWVIGGRDSLYQPMNDVWYSSDGATWTKATADADFSPRQGHAGLVYGNKMWVINGYGFDGSDMAKDIWNSTDGTVWKQVTDSTCFNARAFHSTLVFRNRLWVIAGMAGNATLANDVWRSGVLGK
jgi:N-acetylneuraminic acid mutarotase